MHFNVPPPSDAQKTREKFRAEYRLAWEAAGKPSRATVEEVLFAATFKEEFHDATLQPLWIFITCELENNTPLNWFSEDLTPFLIKEDPSKVAALAAQKQVRESLRSYIKAMQQHGIVDPEGKGE